MSIFTKKSPADKIRKQYQKLLEQAMHAQRGGDIVRSSELHEQAARLLEQIDALEKA